MKLRAWIVAAGILGVAAACAEAPTSALPGGRTPSGPSYQGGLMYGSGNRTSGSSWENTVGGLPGLTDSIKVTSTLRAGLMYGSGN